YALRSRLFNPACGRCGSLVRLMTARLLSEVRLHLCALIDGHIASRSGAGAGAGPVDEVLAGGSRRGQVDGCALSKFGGTILAAIDAGLRAGHGSRAA